MQALSLKVGLLGLLEESLNYTDKEHGGISYYQDASGKRIQTNAAQGPAGEKVYNDGLIQEGVKIDGSKNDYIASSADYYWTVYNWGGPQYSPNTRYELYIKKNSYIKFREVSLGYNLPAKIAYNDGITKSIRFYYGLRKLSNDNVAGNRIPDSTLEIGNYMASPAVNWDNAPTNEDKLKLLATQKWIHFNVVQPVESWSEMRRLDAPSFSFEVDNANAQKTPPYRWLYASSEQTYNTANYRSVKGRDNLNTKIFWDIK